MTELLFFIDENYSNDKHISFSHGRKLLKTFDFDLNDKSISCVLYYIFNKKTYELKLWKYDKYIKSNGLLYKIISLKEDAFKLYTDIYKMLYNICGEK